GDVEPDQHLGDVPVLAGEGAAERGAGREPGAATGAHAFGALVADRGVVHAVRADRPVTAAAAQVRLAVGVPVAHGYGRLAHAATLAAVRPYRCSGRAAAAPPFTPRAARPYRRSGGTVGRRYGSGPHHPLAAPARARRRSEGTAQVISTRSSTTSCRGRSFASVGTAAIASTTRADSSSATWPKIVCLKLRCGVGATVMKNCEPFVPGPALAIASRYGRSKVSSGWNSSGKV